MVDGDDVCRRGSGHFRERAPGRRTGLQRSQRVFEQWKQLALGEVARDDDGHVIRADEGAHRADGGEVHVSASGFALFVHVVRIRAPGRVEQLVELAARHARGLVAPLGRLTPMLVEQPVVLV